MNILVVDDHDVIRQSLPLIIGAEFPEAKCTKLENATACIELLKKEQFDLLILDMNLPDMDGRDLVMRQPEDERAGAGDDESPTLASNFAIAWLRHVSPSALAVLIVASRLSPSTVNVIEISAVGSRGPARSGHSTAQIRPGPNSSRKPVSSNSVGSLSR